MSGPLAFVCYVAVGFWGISIGAIQDPYTSIPLMVVTHGMGYLVMMAVANICYYVGPFSEEFVKPTDLDGYRRITFGLGFWFSVLLPFSIPALLVILCLIRPSWWQG